MSKSGNTWCKKLMDKDKRNKARFRYGSIVPIMDRIAKQRRGQEVQWPDDSGRVSIPKLYTERPPLPKLGPTDPVARVAAFKPWRPRKHARRVA